uniref:Plexin-B2 n=1 Tax=Callorhinchus milii TaxID=7868 RepID=V9K841_CALMI
MSAWNWILCAFACICLAFTRATQRDGQFRSDTKLLHLAVDDETGRVYVGAVNHLYQLSMTLGVEADLHTGPKKDNPKCIPPINPTSCKNSEDMDNYNKVLLIDKETEKLVICGNIFRGICSLYNLNNFTVFYSDDNGGESTFVAAVDAATPTVALVTTITYSEGSERVMFVGNSRSEYSNALVSTRTLTQSRLKSYFELVRDSSLAAKPSVPKQYPYNFRFVFQNGQFVYFIFSRTRREDNSPRTYVLRLCKDDVNYYSNIEMMLECKDAANNFNLVQSAYVSNPGEKLAQAMTQSGHYGNVTVQDQVLYAVFNQGGLNTDSINRSAFCMFSLNQINEKIEENRETCYSGNGMKNGVKVIYPPYQDNTAFKCNELAPGQTKSYPCSGEHLPNPIASDEGVIVKPLRMYNTNLSAVAVSVENENTIAFLGNVKGEIHKVHLHASADEYQTLHLDPNSKVNSDLVFDAKKEHLYVMTEKNISRLSVQECSRYGNCAVCIDSGDPYCGWCVTEGICSRKSDCKRASEKDHWLWSLNKKCMTVTSTAPQNMSRNDPGEVQLKIDPFPDLNNFENIECYFDHRKTEVVRSEVEPVRCKSLPINEIPATPSNQDFVAVEVELIYNNGGSLVSLAKTHYSFYDCKAAINRAPNTPCMSCVSSPWNCHWEIAEHECKDGDESQSVDVDSVVPFGMASSCPQFFDPSPLLISVGSKSDITFQGKNLDFYKSKKFTLTTADDFMRKKLPIIYAIDNESKRYYQCDKIEFTYDRNETLILQFSVEVDSKKIDSNLEVTLYNCSYGRSDCNLCLAAEERYGCVWCLKGAMSICEYKNLCSKDINSCPAPTIQEIDPMNGPQEGGTLLTIKGSNLGKSAEEIKAITVGNFPCDQVQEQYQTSTRVVCALSAGSGTSQVKIWLTNNKNGTSSTSFTYSDPEPVSIDPKSGPIAGGTRVTITGKRLRTGKMEDVTVLLRDIPCEVKEFGEKLVCVTGRYKGNDTPMIVSIVVRYGKNANKRIINEKFTYVSNPQIKNFEPHKSFSSGGRNITVTGEGFNIIQKQMIGVDVRPLDRTSVAENNLVQREAFRGGSDSVLVFPSPPLEVNVSKFEIVTFVMMDNYKKNLTGFTYVNDPQITAFKDGVYIHRHSADPEQSPIFVVGSNLNAATTSKEVKAFIGSEECKIKTLTETELYCIAPKTQPAPRRQRRDVNDNLPEFIVEIGFRKWSLGKVKYETPAQVQLGVILPLVLIPMLLIIGVSLYCYRRKSQQAEREYKKIQLQLESLEESVRDRCKKEFTDLVTEMDDHLNDVNDVGIPFLDYKTYTDRVFFLPSKDGEKDVMITGKLDIPPARQQTVEQALYQFSNLLNSKSFLIHFIHTLEGQRDFSAREKVYFASLLTVALHGKLEYYTDILRTLLLELMAQYVAKNPKLMLRRSETVVERMLSNWMSICLYQFLKDSAGEPLYRLFKGLKHQVEKGPVDAELKKAKYTLNDTGLLGDDVEYNPLIVNVTIQGEDGEPTPVKVLNCDSITQVKEKILDQVYRNVPFSLRPKLDSVVLEWRPGSTGQILSDLDVTSEREGKWRRLNTLKHYNVRDYSSLILVKSSHSQQPDDHQQIIYGEKSGLLEEDNKRWHLVRPMDEVDEGKSKRGSVKEKERTKAITEIYLTRLLSVKGTLQQFVDNFFQSVLSTNQDITPAVKYFFDFLDEQAHKHDIVDDETIHIWKTNSLTLRFWVNILKNPHFIFDVKVNEVVDASLSVIAQTFMDACTKSEHKLSRDSPSNKLLYAREISTYKKMVDDYYKGIRQMVQVSDQDMNTHLAEVSRAHTDKLNTVVALHQLYQYTNKYYDAIINALEEDQVSQKMQLSFRLQQIAAALENKVTDL